MLALQSWSSKVNGAETQSSRRIRSPQPVLTHTARTTALLTHTPFLGLVAFQLFSKSNIASINTT